MQTAKTRPPAPTATMKQDHGEDTPPWVTSAEPAPTARALAVRRWQPSRAQLRIIDRAVVALTVITVACLLFNTQAGASNPRDLNPVIIVTTAG